MGKYLTIIALGYVWYKEFMQIEELLSHDYPGLYVQDFRTSSI